MATDTDLRGLTVAVTADRRGDDQAVMFSRLGAEVLVGPTISTTKVPDPAALRARTDELLARPPEYLIADTGVGIRAWFTCAAEWGIDEDLRRALAGTRIAARGPKAAGAVSSVGLRVWWRSPTERLSDLVTHLVSEGVAGARVFFQLHGDPGTETVRALGQAGADVTTVPVYVWTPPADPGPAFEVISRCCEGTVDAITFTAGPQVRGLLELADSVGRRDHLLSAMHDMVVGCIGPVCMAAATESGVPVTVVPDHWRLGAMVKAVASALGRRAAP